MEGVMQGNVFILYKIYLTKYQGMWKHIFVEQTSWFIASILHNHNSQSAQIWPFWNILVIQKGQRPLNLITYSLTGYSV